MRHISSSSSLSRIVVTQVPASLDILCSAGMRVLMASGDFHGTALAVARGVGMTPPQGRVIIIQKDTETRSPGVDKGRSAMKSDRHTLESHHARQFSRTVSFAEEEPQNSNCQYKGLVFHQDNGIAAEDDALQALTAIAQVCCFLGLALTHHSTRSSCTHTLYKLQLLICITALCLYMYQIEVAACPRTSSLQARVHCIRVGQHARYIWPWLSYN